jgi:hypothetical protein
VSEELRDLRTKINAETDAVLTAISIAKGVDKAEIARDVLHTWSQEQSLVARLIQKRLRAEGIEGNP